MFYWLELLYYATTGFGLILTGLSLFLGGGQADADADLDADADADLDGHGAPVPTSGGGSVSFSALPIASVRFWMFFADTFGVTGILLSWLGLGPAWVFGIATVVGTSLGYAGFQLFRWLQREQVSGETHLLGYRGAEARVLLPVRPGALGKIVVERLSERVELLATSDHGAELPIRSRVVVVAVRDGVAEVAPLLDPDA